MNGEVLGIYMLEGGSKCSVVIVYLLVWVADITGLRFAGDVWQSSFRACFSFSLFSVVLVSRWQVL